MSIFRIRLLHTELDSGPPVLDEGRPWGDDANGHLPRSTSMEMDAEVQRLQSLLGEMEDQVQRSQIREAEDQSRIAALEDVVAQCKGAIVDVEAKHQDETRKLEEGLQDADRHLSRLRHSLSLVKTSQEETWALLQARTVELEEARRFFCKVDDIDDHDILEIVRTMNSNLYQTACAIATAYQERCGNPRNTKFAERVRRDTRVIDGPLIIHMRRLEYRRAENGLLLQLALQTAMSSFLQEFSAIWGYPVTGRSSTSHTFQELYRRIREHEPQSVSARWRVLSRTYLESPGNVDDQRRQSRDNFLHDVVDVLLACSVANSRHALSREVYRTYGGAFDEMIRLALKFRRLTGKCIVSRDLKIVTAESGEAFDGDWMEDEWTQSKKKKRSFRISRAAVLCTTQLGLVREDIRESSRGRGNTREVVLLKAQVALATILDAM